MDNKTDNLKEEEPFFSEDEKKQYQAAYKKIDETIDVSFYDPEKSFLKIEEIINNIDEKKENNFKKLITDFFSNGKGFLLSPAYSSLSVALIFTLTGVVGWQMNEISEFNNDARNLQSAKTRSVEIANNISQEQKPRELIKEKDDPITFINEIVKSGLKAGVKITLFKNDQINIIIVTNLIANDENQKELKGLLDISAGEGGDLYIKIVPKRSN